MAEAVTVSENVSALAKRLELAKTLLAKAFAFKCEGKIQGIQKIEKQIRSEIIMIQKLLAEEIQLKKHHVNSTNLLHLEGILHLCEYATGVIATERVMRYSIGSQPQVATVDVISNEGSMWIKLFARKRSALHKKWQGEGNFGDKTVSDFARDLKEASKQNPHNFVPPKLSFVFFDGVTESIAEELHDMNISVVGPIYSDDSIEEAPCPLQIAALFRNNDPHTVIAECKPISLQTDAIIDECNLVNFDVSSMLAWVSAITHSRNDHLHFTDKLLEDQAVQEVKDPVLPKLKAATNNKVLLACTTAIRDFQSIVGTVGGKAEKERAKELISIIKEVPDSPSDRALELKLTGKIKPRPRIIFGTGDKIQAVTLTANEKFVRSAVGQGVRFNTIIHPSRALAEIELERCKHRMLDNDKNHC